MDILKFNSEFFGTYSCVKKLKYHMFNVCHSSMYLPILVIQQQREQNKEKIFVDRNNLDYAFGGGLNP